MFKALFTLNASHPLHLSVLNVEYNSEPASFTAALKVFTSDLENAVLKLRNVRLNSGMPDESSEYGALVSWYISQKLTIKFDQTTDKPVTLRYLEKKLTDDFTWLYFTFEKPDSAKSITLTNSVFSELFPDQINLVIFKYNEKNDGAELNNNKTSVTFDFE